MPAANEKGMEMKIKFTWKKFAEILKWVLPIISKGGNNMTTPPKAGMLTAQTITMAPAAAVPGAVAAGNAPSALVVSATGTKISKAKIVGVIVMVLGVARMLGDVTGKWHIPIGAEDTLTDVVSKAGEIISSLLLFLSGLGLHSVRSAQAPTVEPESGG